MTGTGTLTLCVVIMLGISDNHMLHAGYSIFCYMQATHLGGPPIFSFPQPHPYAKIVHKWISEALVAGSGMDLPLRTHAHLTETAVVAVLSKGFSKTWN